MPEHTIPESLIESIRTGRAALVVGAGLGVPSWKQLLERMNARLRSRGREGDAEAAKDVEKLLHKGSLDRAAGFLGRALGEEVCDQITRETWKTSDADSAIAQSIARLPILQIWTTFPGDLIETAATAVQPADWPTLRVAGYKNIDAVNSRRRTLVKILGDFDSYVVTAKSIRQNLSSSQALRDYIRTFYNQGSLIFVGFRFGDPDLSALLDRVFGLLEPSTNDHYMIGSGVGPVTVDELRSEHQIQVVNLAGKGADDTATAALVDYLDTLCSHCEDAGISLAQRRPDESDLEGWIELLGREYDHPEAQSALRRIETDALAKGDYDRLIELYLSKVELEDSAHGRADLLRKVAEVYENHLGDVPRAFTALSAALREHPSDLTSLDAAERLASAADGWSELVGDVSEAVADIEDRAIASMYWLKLAGWYDSKLHHFDYAAAAYREAIKLKPAASEGYEGLARLLRKQQRWAELATVLSSHADVETNPGKQAAIYRALGDLYENQLASTAEAIQSYELGIELEEESDECLCGLERIYRRDERWGKLAQVLTQKADFFHRQGDAGRAAAIREELGELRAVKLGDVEGMIKRHEETVTRDEKNVASLTALVDLYDKVGRPADLLRILTRLVEVSDGREKVEALERLGVEVEKRQASPEQAIAAYRKLLEINPESEEARRGLTRAFRQAEKWDELVPHLEAETAAAAVPGRKAEFIVELAEVFEVELQQPHKAIEQHLRALELVDGYSTSLVALGRLYQVTENWDRALAALARSAEAESSADLWCETGELAAERISDLDVAKGFFNKALELDAGHVGALKALAGVHERSGDIEQAARGFVAAERQSHNRDERVSLLTRAATLYHRRMEDLDRGLAIYRKILDLDPQHVGAAESAGSIYLALNDPKGALPILEQLVVHADEPQARARHLVLLGDALSAAGDFEEAAAKYDAASDLDKTNVGAHIGRSRARFEHAKASDDEILWRDVARLYDELLSKFGGRLDDGQRAELWRRHGVACRAIGDVDRAEASLRKALSAHPTDVHALGVLSEVAAQKGDYSAVIDAKRKLLSCADEDERKLRLLEQIGDIYVEHLHRPEAALEAYGEGVALDAKAHVLIHKSLEIYTVKKQWDKAVGSLDALAETENDAGRRAKKYHYAAAVIARDEVGDRDLALEKFSLTLDDDPNNAKAFEAIDKLLAVGDDYQALARAYRQMIRRVGQEAPSGRLIRLWSRLGEICAEHLDDPESAMAAYEVAVSLEPDNLERHEALVNLYLEAGDEKRGDAIRELHVLLDAQPDRVELYHALFGLYEQESDLDRLYCLAQALVLLGAATPAQQALYESYRPQSLTLAKRKLTNELWQKAIPHSRENRHLSAIFSSVIGALAASTARPAAQLKLDPSRRADLESDGRLVSKVLRYGADVLALDLKPQLYIDQSNPTAIRVANAADDGRLMPALMVGAGLTDKKDQREIAFEIGKRLAFFRPERYVNYAMGGLPMLQQAYSAVLAATGAPGSEKADDQARALAERLRKTLPSPVLDQVGVVARKLNADPKNGELSGWHTATDLTANRVGLILCNDLETAAKLVATESSPQTTMSAKDRLRDLIAYAASEEYFSVRRHLGLSLATEQSAQ